MTVLAPHFLLYCTASRPSDEEGRGGWRFVLQAAEGGPRLAAEDRETGMSRSRLELLAVIRGLEALDEPSRVTLVTSSRYVGGGLRYGLEQWRRTDWQWERFGVMSPIKNGDLWRRLDSALSYHVVECRVRAGRDVPNDLSQRFRVDAHAELAGDSRGPATEGAMEDDRQAQRSNDPHWPRPGGRWRRAAAAMGSAAAAACALLWLRAG